MYELRAKESSAVIATYNREHNWSKSAAARTQRHGGKRKHLPYCTRKYHLLPSKTNSAEEQLQQHNPSEHFRHSKDRIMKDHELYCSPYFISQRYHSTSKLKELSFLLSSAWLPTPKDLLHKRLCSLLHLYIFIDSALKKVTYYFIVLQIAPTFKVKFTLYLYLRFEC